MARGAKPKTYDAALVEHVRTLYAAEHTQHEVAEKLGLTQKVVFNIMRRHSISARVAAKRDQRGEKNASWRGDMAGYHAFHRRLYALHGKPTRCTVCNTSDPNRTYDYANLSGRYQDIEDFAAMCRSCHWKYDEKILNIKKMRRDADAQGS